MSLLLPRSNSARRTHAGAWHAPALLSVLFIPPLVAILLVVLSITPAPRAARPPTTRVAPVQSVALVTHPCCVRWRPTALSVETDALIADRQQPGALIAGTTSGIWRSSDGGLTWRQDATAPRHDDFLALAMTKTGSVLAAGDGNGVIFMRGPGSADGWRAISSRLGGGAPIFSIAVSADARTLLAGTSGTLYRGALRAGHWQWQAVAQTNQSSITAIVWAPWNPHIAFASVFGTQPPVLISTDAGATWHADRRGLPDTLPTVAMLVPILGSREVVLSTMGEGVWQRSSAGQWRDISGNLPEHHAMPLAVAGNGTMFAGTMGYGVYMQQGATSWARLGHELNGGAYTVLSLAVATGAHPALLAGTAEGVYRIPLR